MNNKIIVIGSMNMDMVARTCHIPRPGETVIGSSFFMNPGGKGANQAVAASRLGGNVVFSGRIGKDSFGKQISHSLKQEGINTASLIEDSTSPTGIALITVDEKGENSIVVASGANLNLSEKDALSTLNKNSDGQILLMQLEIPLESVRFAAEIAKQRSMSVIVNPAPANPRISSLYHLIDVLTPNISEAEILSDVRISSIDDVKKAAEKLVSQGVKNVIVTMGKEGALLCENNTFFHIRAPEVNVVDTTAAGDVFNGALAVAIAEDMSLVDSVRFACQYAALSVTKKGAQSSIPFRKDVVISSEEL